MSAWSTPADVESRVRRRWDDGSLLREYASGEPLMPIEVPLRGPAPSRIGDDLAAARAWVQALTDGGRDGARYTLRWREVGGRSIGRNRIPVRAVVETFAQAWALLGVARAVRTFDDLLAPAGQCPAVRDWVLRRPLVALELAGDWPALLAAYAWLDANRGSGAYLREVSAPGVDTKFAERHRGVLAEMLGVSANASRFLADLGLASRPELVRLRPSPELGLPAPLTELAVRADELARLDVAPARAVVVENEVTYLSVDVPLGGVVIWGRGFDVDRVGRLPWLAGCDVVYWGDLDTHGFAILDRLRAWLPQARSVLMDAATLLEHRDRWVTEDRPTQAALTRLTPEEDDVYRGLVSDRWGERVRLEQERIDWAWATSRLGRPDAGGALVPLVE